MIITHKWSTILFLLLAVNVQAQKLTISGRVMDASTKEVLIGASVINVNNGKGVITNQYGYYAIPVVFNDSTSLVFSYNGYRIATKRLVTGVSFKMDMLLFSNADSLKEVVVSAKSNNRDVQKPRMGVIDVSLESIRTLPVLLGERDVMKIIQLLPGVQGGEEGTSGYFVRGGNLDQNLVQLDEATVYNPNHLFGLFSTFNINAINHVQLIKGGFPPEFGGRLSSILDITMKEGNKNKYQTEGGIGLFAENLTIQGPIRKNKSSFIVSGRKSHLNMLIHPISSSNTSYTFYDLNAKVNFEMGDRDRLFLSFFKGNDAAGYNNANSLNYTTDFGNTTGTMRWNHLFGDRIFSNTSLIYNYYNLSLATSQNNYYSLLYTAIRDVSTKTDFTLNPGGGHKIKTGLIYTYHALAPASFSDKIPGNGSRISVDKKAIKKLYSQEMAFYLGDEFNVSPGISVNYGFRLPYYQASSKSYAFFEPRMTTKFNLGPDYSIMASYTKMNQFLHLIPNSTAGLPTDIWIPSSEFTRPQSSSQYALGFFSDFKKNMFTASLEVYFKSMNHQVLLGEGKQLKINADIDSLLVYGKGQSYGAELFINKNYGKWTGWLSYSLSKSIQTFSDLNAGKKFPFKYDRPHVFNITASYHLNAKWIFSGIFYFSSGHPYTIPTGRVSTMNSGTIFEGNYYVFDKRNNYRLAKYHRLDLSASNKKKVRIFKRSYEREWSFGIYNVYSRQNPYFVYFEINAQTDKPTAKQVSLLPILPSVSFNFKF